MKDKQIVLEPDWTPSKFGSSALPHTQMIKHKWLLLS